MLADFRLAVGAAVWLDSLIVAVRTTDEMDLSTHVIFLW